MACVVCFHHRTLSYYCRPTHLVGHWLCHWVPPLLVPKFRVATGPLPFISRISILLWTWFILVVSIVLIHLVIFCVWPIAATTSTAQPSVPSFKRGLAMLHAGPASTPWVATSPRCLFLAEVTASPAYLFRCHLRGTFPVLLFLSFLLFCDRIIIVASTTQPSVLRGPAMPQAGPPSTTRIAA